MTSPSARATARSRTVSSSRTLPGHGYLSRASIASGAMGFGCLPRACANREAQRAARASMSERLSRSGGTVMVYSRKSSCSSLRKSPSRTASESLGPAPAIRRTFTVRPCPPPTRAVSPPRSRRTIPSCAVRGRASTPSRNSVPPSASSHLPGLPPSPSNPNSSLRIRLRGMPPQCTATKGASRRRPALWMA